MSTKLGKQLGVALAILGFAISSAYAAASERVSTTPLQGYDAVAYHAQGKAVKGNGFNVFEYHGATYLFATKENKEAFETSPERYLPGYGGFCAYGVAVGKKFEADAEVWEIVDGRLYLNLDREIQKKWRRDIPGYIRTGDKNWAKIKDKPASTL